MVKNSIVNVLLIAVFFRRYRPLRRKHMKEGLYGRIIERIFQNIHMATPLRGGDIIRWLQKSECVQVCQGRARRHVRSIYPWQIWTHELLSLCGWCLYQKVFPYPLKTIYADNKKGRSSISELPFLCPQGLYLLGGYRSTMTIWSRCFCLFYAFIRVLPYQRATSWNTRKSYLKFLFPFWQVFAKRFLPPKYLPHFAFCFFSIFSFLTFICIYHLLYLFIYLFFYLYIFLFYIYYFIFIFIYYVCSNACWCDSNLFVKIN